MSRTRDDCGTGTQRMTSIWASADWTIARLALSTSLVSTITKSENLPPPELCCWPARRGAGPLLRDNTLIYGVGGVIVPFVGIKLIDMILVAMGMA